MNEVFGTVKMFEQRGFDGEFIERFYRGEDNLRLAGARRLIGDEFDNLPVGEALPFTGQTLLVRTQ